MKIITAILLLFTFSASFSFETIEYFVFGHSDVVATINGIPEIEDDQTESEESKEEEDEKKIDDDFFAHSTLYDFYSILFSTLLFSNKHFLPSRTSSKFSPPPESV